MAQTAPKTVDPNAKQFVIEDSNGNVVAKYDTNAPIRVPESVGEFEVIELTNSDRLDTYDYNSSEGYQS
jgi:hypothetical protein